MPGLFGRKVNIGIKKMLEIKDEEDLFIRDCYLKGYAIGYLRGYVSVRRKAFRSEKRYRMRKSEKKTPEVKMNMRHEEYKYIMPDREDLMDNIEYFFEKYDSLPDNKLVDKIFNESEFWLNGD